MSESLRSLVLQSQLIEEQLVESGGELSEELERALTTLDVKLPAKVDGCAVALERLEMYEEYWKAKAKQFNAIAKGLSSARDRFKDYLKTQAEALGTTELVGNEVRFKISNSNPKLVVDQLNLSSEYLIEKVVVEADTERIKEDLKAGKVIEGAKLETSKSIRVYANKGAK